MATAYAAITSLMNLITQINKHPNPPIKLDHSQVNSLKSNISLFQEFLEDHHTSIDGRLEMRIADKVHATEDLIETHIADPIIDFDISLQRAIEGLDLIKEEVRNMNWNEKNQSSNQSTGQRVSPQPPFSENILVGIGDITITIIDTITSPSVSDRQIISITGMGGIGKTTVALKVYDHRVTKDYFDICAWATISENYNARRTLVHLLRALNEERLSDMSEHDLGVRLYQHLFGRRYLVVLDDVRDVETWDRLRSYFPQSSGSRIVITTRESSVAAISTHNFGVGLLDERNSLDLFCAKVFGQGHSCPLELEDVGKNIVGKCGGLPLSIVAIGGHLARLPRTREYWEYVENNLSSVVNLVDEGRSLSILSKSYNNLPVHLKPCFLYMAIFSEDVEIRASRLISLWVAEGFVKPINGKSLEEAAETYLHDLIGRSFVIPSGTSVRRIKIKKCKIDRLLRKFCIKEAVEKKFLYIAQKVDDLRAVRNERRIVRCLMESPKGCSLSYCNASRSKALRTFIFDGELSSLKDPKLLRVLAPVNGSSSFLFGKPDAHRLVNIRYFDPSVPILQEIRLPSSLFTLWNLQYLFINVRLDRTAPLEIWKMTQLRVVNVKDITLSCPPRDSEATISNLQSAKTIINFSFCEEAVRRIPHVKKLNVRYDRKVEGFDEGAFALNNIDRLEKLESFKFDLSPPRNATYFDDILQNVSFPSSLRELSFSHLRWEDVNSKIGLLPVLEVLRLCDCEGTEWELVEGEFPRLRVLQLSCCYLESIRTESYMFPCLESLDLEFMFCLKEIPSAIGDIQTLSSIDLFQCPHSVVDCVKQVAYEQYNRGNERLQVKVWSVEGSPLSEGQLGWRNFHVYKS